MAGTKVGGSKARETNKAKYGSDFYAQIGRIGGHNGHTGGFAANPGLAKEAGRLGGLKSKRPKGVKRSRAAEQRDIELKIADFKEKMANTRTEIATAQETREAQETRVCIEALRLLEKYGYDHTKKILEDY